VFGEPRRILYVVNAGKKKAAKVIDRLLEIPDTHLTITVGRDAELKAKLLDQTREQKDRIRIFGWTNQMPQLMLSSHLVIGKAGGAAVRRRLRRVVHDVNQVVRGRRKATRD